MKQRLSLQYAFELIFALITLAAVIAVLQTFVIGQHYIIPSVILVIAVVTGNLAWHGFQDRIWAKQILFWSGFLFTAHAFFALFWSKRYRELLGDSFEWVCGAVFVVFAFLVYQYAVRNRLFRQ
ncbi:MAG: hypothetical protein R3E82_10570 [Pseudomonadales bacterium]|nr:hypothetical protein [Pseudomonadales bacterium]